MAVAIKKKSLALFSKYPCATQHHPVSVKFPARVYWEKPEIDPFFFPLAKDIFFSAEREIFLIRNMQAMKSKLHDRFVLTFGNKFSFFSSRASCRE